jgi:hypothetical protein
MWGKHCVPALFTPSWTTLFIYFFRFAINLREKNIKPDWVYSPGSLTSFIMDDTIHVFLFKKKYFLFLFLFFKKIILILILFIFRLISLLFFMLFKKFIWNEDYFLIIHLIFEEVYLLIYIFYINKLYF